MIVSNLLRIWEPKMSRSIFRKIFQPKELLLFGPCVLLEIIENKIVYPQDIQAKNLASLRCLIVLE
jgi:hypothetical protein